MSNYYQGERIQELKKQVRELQIQVDGLTRQLQQQKGE